MIRKDGFAHLAVAGLVAAGVLLTAAGAGSQTKPGHKFYFADKAPVVTDDSEVTTRIIVGDDE